jgi:Xaa-Pro aminopeptidase
VASRHERLRDGFAERGCSSAILAGQAHAVHLAGYSRYLGGPAAVVVDAEAKRTLVVPRYELEAAEASARADDVVGYGAADFLDFDPLPKLAAACLARAGKGRVGFAGDAGAELAGSISDWVRVDDLAAEVQARKDPDELELIARSYELALVAQQAVVELLAEGASEIELCSAAHAAAQNAAGEPIELISVVVSGPRSALVSSPVCVSCRRRAAPGDPVLADLAVRCAGYWGDTTRTSIRGANPAVAEARDAVAAIVPRLARLLRPGTRASEIHQAAATEILSRFPDGSFPHHAGHGIGIAVAEGLQLVPTDSTPLEAGMVLAIEPGVYFEGRFGVRVEDMYVVTEDGGRIVRALGA